MSDLLNEIKNFEKDKLKKSNIHITFSNGKTDLNQIDFEKGIIQIPGEKIIQNTFKIYGFIPNTKPDLEVGNINSYLSFGSQDAASSWKLIQSNSISHIINLCSDFIPNYFQDKEIVYLNLSIRDDEIQNIQNSLTESLEFIKSMRKQNVLNKCLIHCNAGMSRSPSIAIGILMRFEKLSFDLAFSMVATTNRGHIQPNANFIRQLKNYDNFT